uniref:ATPase family AAA domain-containing protein n=1 Tax=Meloidogyne incognita TaxID=6306 RepID=A0A914NRV3_MELIC
MSWIFGFKQPQQVSVPQDGTSLENDNRSQAAGSAQQQQEIGAKTAFSFDSTALERAAQAAKSLEKSSNAKQALELSRLQEVSKQKEYELQQKQIELRMASIQSENIRVAEEERRKTLIEETKHSRARADYQDQLARKRQEEDAAIKARLQEESLRRQEESIKKQEAMRKGLLLD